MKSKRSAIELVKYYRIMGHAYLARTEQRFVEVRDPENRIFTISGAFNAEFTAAIAAPNGLGSQRAGSLLYGRPEVPTREVAVQRTARAGTVSRRRNGVLCFLFV